jgi:hypothetical protein
MKKHSSVEETDCKSKQRKFQLLKALNEAFGEWEDRNLNPESFVRKLREGKRLEEKITAKDLLETVAQNLRKSKLLR